MSTPDCQPLRGRCIILGVCGGIAAYKAVEVLQLLIKSGADVHVVMTSSAREFVGSLTFETLSRNPVYTQTLALTRTGEIAHIALAQKADLALVAPATANLIGKFAHGIADDALTTLLISVPTHVPVYLAPAMDRDMYTHPAVSENLGILTRRGVLLLGPEEGFLASGLQGKGRLAGPKEIVRAVTDKLAPRRELQGMSILITAGPTQEPVDPVRFLSNRSSGKMGYALAAAAVARGARVILISGPVNISAPAGLSQFVAVTTAAEMREAVMSRLGEVEVVIKAAAVADFRPQRPARAKIKKEGNAFSLELERTPDILSEIGAMKKDRILVGFAAETNEILENACRKLKEKNLDLLIVNDVGRTDIGFHSDYNQIILVSPDGTSEETSRLPKREIADIIMDRIVSLSSRRRG